MDAIDKINALLTQRGMSGADLERAIGVSNSVYSQWNTRVTKPSKKSLAKVAVALNVDIYEIMPDAENKKIPTAPEGGGYTEEELMWLEWLRARATPQQKAIIRLMFEEAE